jgi:hypothetical protein
MFERHINNQMSTVIMVLWFIAIGFISLQIIVDRCDSHFCV